MNPNAYESAVLAPASGRPHSRRTVLASLVLGLLAVATPWGGSLRAEQSAPLAVIVNQGVPVDALGKAALASIFTRANRTWKDGSPIRALNLLPQSPERIEFDRVVLHMEPGAERPILDRSSGARQSRAQGDRQSGNFSAPHRDAARLDRLRPGRQGRCKGTRGRVDPRRKGSCTMRLKTLATVSLSAVLAWLAPRPLQAQEPAGRAVENDVPSAGSAGAQEAAAEPAVTSATPDVQQRLGALEQQIADQKKQIEAMQAEHAATEAASVVDTSESEHPKLSIYGFLDTGIQYLKSDAGPLHDFDPDPADLRVGLHQPLLRRPARSGLAFAGRGAATLYPNGTTNGLNMTSTRVMDTTSPSLQGIDPGCDPWPFSNHG